MPKAATLRRVVFRVDVTPQTAKKFAAMCEETGVSQIAATSRLVQWFSAQESEVQARILGVLGEQGKKEAAMIYLKKIADGK